jgi:hypothetical protein
MAQLFMVVDRGFINWTSAFGIAGRWLQSDQGRAFLGWSGVAMMAAAAIWAVVLFFG